MPATRGLHLDADLTLRQGGAGVQVAAAGDHVRIRLSPSAAWALWRAAPDRTTRRRWRDRADRLLRHAKLSASVKLGPFRIARLGRTRGQEPCDA